MAAMMENSIRVSQKIKIQNYCTIQQSDYCAYILQKYTVTTMSKKVSAHLCLSKEYLQQPKNGINLSDHQEKQTKEDGTHKIQYDSYKKKGVLPRAAAQLGLENITVSERRQGGNNGFPTWSQRQLRSQTQRVRWCHQERRRLRGRSGRMRCPMPLCSHKPTQRHWEAVSTVRSSSETQEM